MNEKLLSDVIEKLRGGKADLTDANLLSSLSAAVVADFLLARFPYRLQERQLRAHRELTLARSLQFLSRPILPGAFLLATVSKPVYRPCVFLTAEGDQATGLTWRAFQTLQPSRKDGRRAIRLTTGPGCGLHRTIDGWVAERLPKKTVVLTEDFLRSRGWQSGTQNFVFAGS